MRALLNADVCVECIVRAVPVRWKRKMSKCFTDKIERANC